MLRIAAWIAGGIAIVVVIVALYLLTYRPDSSSYPLRGVDVSRHQGKIEWRRVAADDVAFAYIKATEGGDWRDPQFKINWREAKNAGLATGAYHFFTCAGPAAIRRGTSLRSCRAKTRCCRQWWIWNS